MPRKSARTTAAISRPKSMSSSSDCACRPRTYKGTYTPPTKRFTVLQRTPIARYDDPHQQPADPCGQDPGLMAKPADDRADGKIRQYR